MSSPLSDNPASSPGSDQPAEDTAGTSHPAGTEQPAANADPASRPVIAVALLAGHPGNVRRDLRLTPEFLASVAASGILVPLRVTPAGDGRYRVIDGHRRLAAALRAGLTEVPAGLPAGFMLLVDRCLPMGCLAAVGVLGFGVGLAPFECLAG
jgi:hypothetical protein